MAREAISATQLTTSCLVVAALVVSATALGGEMSSGDVVAMVQEMQHANYFTFVMLLNMAQDELPRNATFLMPSDRVLSRTPLPENDVPDFLRRHSIPSPLLFEDVRRLPTGTTVPTCRRDYALTVSNGGRKSFYLNNARVTAINICTAGAFFRCHGIDDVLNPVAAAGNGTSSVACPKIEPPTAAAAAPSAPPTVSPPPAAADLPSPSPSESSDGHRRPGSPDGLFRLPVTVLVSCIVALLLTKNLPI